MSRLRGCLRAPGRCLRWLWDNRPENSYRDVALVVIAVILYLAVNALGDQQDNQDRQQDAQHRQTVRLRRVVLQNRALNLQFCKLIRDVHRANVARVQSEEHRLTVSLNFLRNLPPNELATNLADRVRENIPFARADVRSARTVERATRVPPACLGPLGSGASGSDGRLSEPN